MPDRAANLRQLTLRGDDEDFDNTAYVVPTEQQRWSVVYFGAEAADDPAVHSTFSSAPCRKIRIWR